MQRRITRWFPDRSPTWLEVLLCLGALGQVAIGVGNGSLVWPWFAVGFTVFLLGMGPASATTAGRRFGAWFRAIGVGGRAALVVAFAVVAWTAILTEALPVRSLSSLAVGGLMACLVYLLAFFALARDIEGWRTHDGA